MNGRYIYHLAIIDYLQAYDWNKKSENLLKIWIYNQEEYKTSAVNPVLYMNRFFKFMKENVIVNQKQKRDYSDRETLVRSFRHYDNNATSGGILPKLA